jgi:glycosyltransferase involved in cell wall biosynthesis
MTKINTQKFLFNFSASYLGGGYKRIYEFVKYFNNNGGSNFILHTKCIKLEDEFPNNKYFFIKQTVFERIFNDGVYIEKISSKIGDLQLYYSYSIPIYNKVAKVNWYHLSNVLPLVPFKFPLSIFDKFKMFLLGFRIKKKLINAEVISGESRYSIGLITKKINSNYIISVNGSDDEINYLEQISIETKKNFAVVLGTYKYKSVNDSFKIFQKLKENNPELKLIIIGDKKYLSKHILKHKDVNVKGLLSRKEVISLLLNCKIYISTTLIENSYNAASEGIFFADESYISDIEPHRELLKGLNYELIKFDKIDQKLIYVQRNEINLQNLKLWRNIIEELIVKVDEILNT